MSADTIMNLSKLIQDLKQRVSILEFEVAELKKNKNDTQQQPVKIEKRDPINPVIPYDNFIPFERAGHENDESYRCHRFGLYAAEEVIINYIMTFAQSQHFRLSNGSDIYFVDITRKSPQPSTVKSLHIVFSNDEFIDCEVVCPSDGLTSAGDLKVSITDCSH